VRHSGIGDGTSNTALFAEALRGNLAWNGSGFDNTTMIIVNTGWNDTNHAAVARCQNSNGSGNSFVRYVGHQYYRNLPATNVYSHTLPVNFNKKNSNAAAQKYPCGSNSDTPGSLHSHDRARPRLRGLTPPARRADATPSPFLIREAPRTKSVSSVGRSSSPLIEHR
jgi:hypothetical protein